MTGSACSYGSLSNLKVLLSLIYIYLTVLMSPKNITVVGHKGGLTNPRPWRGKCRARFSNTGGPPLPRKRAPLQKNITVLSYHVPVIIHSSDRAKS